MKEYINPNEVTGIYCTPEMFYDIQNVLKKTFPTITFLYTKLFPNDVTNREGLEAIIEKTYKGNYRENLAQIRQQYYWSLIIKEFKQ